MLKHTARHHKKAAAHKHAAPHRRAKKRVAPWKPAAQAACATMGQPAGETVAAQPAAAELNAAAPIGLIEVFGVGPDEVVEVVLETGENGLGRPEEEEESWGEE